MWLTLNHFGKENPNAAAPGQSSLVLQTYSSYDWRDCWGIGQAAGPRPEAYSRLKERVAAELTGLAENLVPGLGIPGPLHRCGNADFQRTFFPEHQGLLGRLVLRTTGSPPVYRFPFLNLFSTPLRNLRACGHYSLWPGGVITAALSGKIVANLSSGRKPLKKL